MAHKQNIKRQLDEEREHVGRLQSENTEAHAALAEIQALKTELGYKNETANVFMGQVKKLQAENAELREERDALKDHRDRWRQDEANYREHVAILQSQVDNADAYLEQAGMNARSQWRSKLESAEAAIKEGERLHALTKGDLADAKAYGLARHNDVQRLAGENARMRDTAAKAYSVLSMLPSRESWNRDDAADSFGGNYGKLMREKLDSAWDALESALKEGGAQ